MAEQNGEPKSFYSRIEEGTNEMLLLVYRPLDFEVTPEYTLTIKAAVCCLYRLTRCVSIDS